MTRFLSILHRLNPVALLLGPTFQKEMRTAGRRRGTYWLRGLYAAGLLAIVTIAFSGMRDMLSGMSSLQRAQALQSLAPRMTFVVVWFQFIAMVLVAPMITAPVVCEERRQRTLAALLTTPLTSGQIVLGKLASRIVQLVILSLLATPLLLAIRVFGGLDTEVVIAAASISVSTAFLGATLGVLHSVWHRRPAPAALAALLALGLIQGGPAALTTLILLTMDAPGGARGGPPEFLWRVMTTCSPAVLGVIGTRGLGMGGISIRELWVGNTIYNLGWAALIATATAVALRRAMIREASMEGGAARPSRRERRAARRAAAIGVPGPASEAEPAGAVTPERAVEESSRERVVGDRPVLWREIRAGTFGSRRNFVVIIGLSAAILLLLYWRINFYEQALHVTISIIGALAVMVQSVFLTTGGVTTERESRTWDALVCTPLSGAQIVLGKYAGALKGQWFLPSIVGGHLTVAALAGAVHPLVLLHVAMIFAGPILLFSALGVLLSLVFRRSTAAAVCNIAGGLAIWGGSWLVAGLVVWFFEVKSEDWFEAAMRVCFAINPLPMIISAVDGATGFSSHRGSVRLGSYELFDSNVDPVVFTGYTVGVFVAYAAVATGVLTFATSRFTRLSGRAS